MLKLRFNTAQEAWEGLNEYLSVKSHKVVEKGGVIMGSQIVSYENYITIESTWVDPEFDFGDMFGYTKRKWTSLVLNYVNMHELDKFRNKILDYELGASSDYTAHMNFFNAHKSGKSCLVSLIVCKQKGKKKPIAYFNVRAGEITKRVLIDFLLIQRILEYIYGSQEIEMRYISPMIYITAENFAMYHTHRNIHKLLEGSKNKVSKRLLEVLDKFLTTDPKTIKYKVNLRSVNQLQRGKDGKAISGRKPLLAKHLNLW